jgi:mRNA-degrading endonuclease RelE of RelBE toxin-antitoxin system
MGNKVEVTISPKALQELDELPRVIHGRVLDIVKRLRDWPQVSGAKPLRHDRKGRYRIRTGRYRVQFRVEGTKVVVEQIGHRDGFYED